MTKPNAPENPMTPHTPAPRMAAAVAATCAAALALALALTGCAFPGADMARVSAAAGVSVPTGRLVVDEGAHAQGQPGCATWQVVLSENQAAQLEAELAASASWQELPMPKALECTLYGADGDGRGLVTPANDEDFFPHVTRGYALFRDRLADDATPADPQSQLAGAFSHASVSITVGLYDADACTLYLYEIDA